MKAGGGNRRVALCLLASAGMHLLALWLVYTLAPPEVDQRLFRVRLPSVLPVRPARFRPRPAVPVSRQLLERLRAENRPAAPDVGAVGETAGTPPEIEPPAPDERLAGEQAGERLAWPAWSDTLPDAGLGLLEQTGEMPLGLDLVELDAIARRRTVVLIDPETRKLKRAYLHLPLYRNDCGKVVGGSMEGILEMSRRGFLVPEPVPVIHRLRYIKLGCPVETPGQREILRRAADPLHQFFAHPRRHILHRTEMSEYPVLYLDYIDVESTDAMVQYLLAGGFGVVNHGQLSVLHRALQAAGKRVAAVTIELDHPLFHAWYDIDRYFPGGPCPGTGPLPGLELDGRLIAVIRPPFTLDKPCPANRLFVNVLAYALVQPSPMGGRYRAGKADD